MQRLHNWTARTWTGRTAHLCALAQLLLSWGPAVAAQHAGLADAQTLNGSSAAPEPGSNGWTGIQVFETPGSSQQIQAADEHLTQQIKARLEADPWVLSYKVHVRVRGGVVTLEGCVDTLLAKERAAQVTQTIPGARAIANHIQMVLPPREDQMIHDEVQGCFLRNLPLARSSVEVEVEGGDVILSGMVGSQYRKQLAETLAESVTGVRGVENKLRVNHLVARSDRDIQLDVESRIEWDPGLVNPQVSVEVHSGTVQLAGMVESRSGKARAVQDARVAGVKAVKASDLAIWEETPAALGGATSGDGALRGP